MTIDDDVLQVCAVVLRDGISFAAGRFGSTAEIRSCRGASASPQQADDLPAQSIFSSVPRAEMRSLAAYNRSTFDCRTAVTVPKRPRVPLANLGEVTTFEEFRNQLFG